MQQTIQAQDRRIHESAREIASFERVAGRDSILQQLYAEDWDTVDDKTRKRQLPRFKETEDSAALCEYYQPCLDFQPNTELTRLPATITDELLRILWTCSHTYQKTSLKLSESSNL